MKSLGRTKDGVQYQKLPCRASFIGLARRAGSQDPSASDTSKMFRALNSVHKAHSVARDAGLKVCGTGGRHLAVLVEQTTGSATRDEGEAAAMRVLGNTNPSLFHRQVDVVVREGHKRETRRLRKGGLWIPSCVQGRGKLDDLQIKVPIAPLQEDFFNGLFAIQKRGKSKWSGPLYQLRLIQDENAEGEEFPKMVENPTPFETIRVKPHNMMLNQITEDVKTVAFVYCPENEPVRVRVPIKYINEEKCPGLRSGGWLNRVQQCVDITVAPFTRAPLFATQDVGGMSVKDRKTIGNLQFEGKGNGCRTVLSDDTVATIISKV